MLSCHRLLNPPCRLYIDTSLKDWQLRVLLLSRRILLLTLILILLFMLFWQHSILFIFGCHRSFCLLFILNKEQPVTGYAVILSLIRSSYRSNSNRLDWNSKYKNTNKMFEMHQFEFIITGSCRERLERLFIVDLMYAP